MNLWDRILALYGYLIIPLALFLCACEAESDLGADILNINEDSIETRVARIPLEVSMQRVDSVITNNNPQVNGLVPQVNLPVHSYLIGQAQSPDLGTITAKSFIQLSPEIFSGGTIAVADTDIFVSSRLSLIRSGQIFGENSVDQEILVREILEPLAPFDNNEDVVFFRDQNFETSDTIGFATVNLFLDTLIVNLNDNFGEKIFDLLRGNDFIFATQENLNSVFNGISIEGTENNDAIFEINAQGNISSLEIFVRGPNEIEERAVRLFIKNVGSGNTRSIGFSQVLFDENGLTISEILSNPSNSSFNISNNTIVYNSLLGVIPNIDLSNYCTWLSEQGEIIVNNIDLIININEQDVNDFPVPNLQIVTGDSISNFVGDSLDVFFLLPSDLSNVNVIFDDNTYQFRLLQFLENTLNCNELNSSSFNSLFSLTTDFQITQQGALGRNIIKNLNSFTAQEENIFLEVIFTDLGN